MRRYSAEMRRTHGIEVQIRVGLNSGEVVVRAIGNDLQASITAPATLYHFSLPPQLVAEG
jgi:class 3 adenylate cyclase